MPRSAKQRHPKRGSLKSYEVATTVYERGADHGTTQYYDVRAKSHDDAARKILKKSRKTGPEYEPELVRRKLSRHEMNELGLEEEDLLDKGWKPAPRNRF